jgi:hypothetical protein
MGRLAKDKHYYEHSLITDVRSFITMGPKVIPLPYALYHYLLSKAQIKKNDKFSDMTALKILSVQPDILESFLIQR